MRLILTLFFSVKEPPYLFYTALAGVVLEWIGPIFSEFGGQQYPPEAAPGTPDAVRRTNASGTPWRSRMELQTHRCFPFPVTGEDWRGGSPF